MRILYDHQIFSRQEYGGISRYFYEIIKRMKEFPGYSADLSVLISTNHYLDNNFKHYKFIPNIKFKGKWRIIYEVNKCYSIYKIKGNSFNVFHPTYYSLYFLKYLDKKPFVLTVYDMIHEKIPTLFSKSDETSKLKYILCKNANKIIAISNNTKKDLIEMFKIPEEKIRVIYLASSLINKNNRINDNTEIPYNYILYVGSRSHYKNYELFLRAIAPLLKKNRELKLLLGGGNEIKKSEEEILSELNIKSQVVYIKITSDNQLAYLYKNAICFVYPSLYEGFGIPILEAFSCGCPVVLSNTSSFPEVAGNAGLYFDPYSESSIRNSVEKILENKDLRNDLIKKGYERAKLFSWDITAEKTRKVYESI